MSNLGLNETNNLHNESPESFPITQENPNNAIDMELDKKETVTPGPLSIAKNDFVCNDVIGDSKEHRNDTNEDVDPGILPNIAELKVQIIIPAARQKSTIREFYDSMVDFGKQQRLARQIRRQKQGSLQTRLAAIVEQWWPSSNGPDKRVTDRGLELS